MGKISLIIIRPITNGFNNQINNALAYPGVFKGLLDNKINKVTTEHKIKAAKSIYEYHLPNINKDQILPSILDKQIPIIISQSFK